VPALETPRRSMARITNGAGGKAVARSPRSCRPPRLLPFGVPSGTTARFFGSSGFGKKRRSEP
jgi:hypothetical protein